MAPPARSLPLARPMYRRLRVYAFDPSLDTQMETAVINRVTLQVPWEEVGDGPVGEYLEVVDVDPASGCFYEPVTLDAPYLLASDGLSPSEGNPQFHQQMVYAVAMTTIRYFERALGRRALWSARRFEEERSDAKRYVSRLRIYPHALREANAYYSPLKKALLFGYFPASSDNPGGHLPGGTVFTCLSHDVVAHETTHALLDGMHRRFNEPSNPDVLAFHEAFADIVALFQHFSLPDVLRSQIARTRGDLASQSLLGQLAQQFGESTGLRGALRDALGSVNKDTGQWEPKSPQPDDMETVTEPHARGGLLVAAVFDGFLSIYKSRVADLLRLATAGNGVLSAGEMHPDLVGRLTEEASKSARHVLTMCIRALDYCPPVDMTFGEYLRALITADTDLVPDDDLHYRVAIIEGFRRHGIYPQEMRTLSPDSLCWQSPRGEDGLPLTLPLPSDLLQSLLAWDITGDRRKIWVQMERKKGQLHEWLFSRIPARRQATIPPSLLTEMGLDLGGGAAAAARAIEIHSIRPTRRIGPDGQYQVDLVIEITQRRGEMLQEDSPRSGPPDFWFRGGCTLIVDMQSEPGRVRYCIAKSINSRRRLTAQRRFLRVAGDSALRATYFGNPYLDETAEPFAMLHRGEMEGETQ